MSPVLNVCACNIGFYDAGATLCVACHFSCLTCNGTASNQCLTCSTTNKRISTPSAGSCFCSAGFYENNVPVCATCHVSCGTCIGSAVNQCITCPAFATSKRTDNSSTTSTCPCSSGFIHTGVQICSACHYSCETCSGTASNQCITCAPGSNRTISSGSCLCNSGFFDDLSNSLCPPCHYSC